MYPARLFELTVETRGRNSTVSSPGEPLSQGGTRAEMLEVI